MAGKTNSYVGRMDLAVAGSKKAENLEGLEFVWNTYSLRK